MVMTLKFSQFQAATLSDSTVEYVGTGSGTNVRSQVPFQWTTATRPVTPYNGLFGYNTNFSQFEYWDAVASNWIQIAGGAIGTVTQVNSGTGLTGGPITTTGTISFASITANSLWANITGSAAVPTVIPLSTFLLATNNLSDVPNKATARTNLGLAIGINVEAWSAVLDDIVDGLMPTSVQLQIGSFNSGTSASNTTFWRGDGTWGTPAGGGTVNAGTTNELAWYAANGSAVSGLATANNGVLITSAGGVPSIDSTLPAAVQGNITTVGIISSGTWNGAIIGLAYGGTNAGLTASNGGIVYSGASALAILSGSGTASQMLQSGSNSAPSWSTTTWPATSTINQLLYSSAANVISGLATANNSVLVTSSGGVPSLSATLPSAVQANITTVGTIGTGVWQGTAIALAYGGTNADLIASNGGIIYSTATAMAILSGTATANQLLMSGASGAPAWSTSTYPATNAVNTLLYASSINTMAALATANSAVLVTSAGGVPSLSTTLPAGLTIPGYQPSLTLPLSLANGGTNASLTASVGGILYSSASAVAILAGTATAGQLLLSGSSAPPTWSTTTYPSTNAINTLLYASSANVMSALATANNSGLLTNGSGVPAWVTATGTGAPVLATSPTLVTPLIGTIYSTNNLPALLLANVASAVNYFEIVPSVASSAVGLQAVGSDTNIIFSISGKGTGGVQTQGTTAAGNASAGYAGEVMTANVPAASALSLSNNTNKDITSLNLTAGDWDVYGNVIFQAGTAMQAMQVWLSTASANYSNLSTIAAVQCIATATYGGLVAPILRVNVSTTTTVYLSCLATFASGTCTGCGSIYARRVR